MEMSPLEIEQKLLELPNKIWKLGEKVVKTHEDLLMAEKELDDQHAKHYLQLKAGDQKMTVSDLNAQTDLVCNDQRLAVIIAQAKYERAKNDSESADKMFSALQSVIKLRSSEMRSIQS
jgi:hypothetical protein